MSESDEPAPASESADPPQTRSKFRKVPGRSERALRERSDNASARPKRLRKVSFTPGLQGSPCEPSADDETLPIKAHRSEAVTRRPSRRKTDLRASRPVSLARVSFPSFVWCEYSSPLSAGRRQRIDDEHCSKTGGCRGRSSRRGACAERARVAQAESTRQGVEPVWQPAAQYADQRRAGRSHGSAVPVEAVALWHPRFCIVHIHGGLLFRISNCNNVLQKHFHDGEVRELRREIIHSVAVSTGY